MPTRVLISLVVLALVSAAADASDTGLTGAEGHPRGRFPLAIAAPASGEPALDAAVRRAVDDWNALFRDLLGFAAFRPVESADEAAVRLTFEARDGSRLMGETRFGVGAHRLIEVPVHIVVFEPRARGQTGRETLVYQVVAHELGHALGLTHVTDPRSLMCCIYQSLDFKDPAVREAYVQARRHPSVESVRGQLRAHYERLWTPRP